MKPKYAKTLAQHKKNKVKSRYDEKVDEAKKQYDVPTQHQRKIAKDTLKMNDVFANIMGGPSKEEAKKILKKKQRNEALTSRRPFRHGGRNNIKIIHPDIDGSNSERIKSLGKRKKSNAWADDGYNDQSMYKNGKLRTWNKKPKGR